jgi:hypothetical protein
VDPDDFCTDSNPDPTIVLKNKTRCHINNKLKQRLLNHPIQLERCPNWILKVGNEVGLQGPYPNPLTENMIFNLRQVIDSSV